MTVIAGTVTNQAPGLPQPERFAPTRSLEAIQDVLVRHQHRNHQLARLGIDKEHIASYFVEDLRAGPEPALAWGPRRLVGLAQLCRRPSLGARPHIQQRPGLRLRNPALLLRAPERGLDETVVPLDVIEAFEAAMKKGNRDIVRVIKYPLRGGGSKL